MADAIDVYWLSYHEDALAHGYWDNGLLDDIFAQGNYRQHILKNKPIPQSDQGGIVIVNGRTHVDDCSKINENIAKLKWVLFIDTGDEEASFPWREIRHPLMRVWVMMPRMNQHDDTSFKLPNGYRPTTRKLLKKIGYQSKVNDWFFAGQVNHERREDCVKELRTLPRGILVETAGFGQEKISYEEYLTHTAQSKIIPCPSGVESPDNFRLYEALEAGCIPIVDAFSTNHRHPGFWRYMLGDDIPFPIVYNWDILPKLLPQLLQDYDYKAAKVFAWWQLKKKQIKDKLELDIKELSR